VPEGGDAYLLRHIIHDWDDDRSVRILRNCPRALRPGGRVLVVEGVVPAGNDPSPLK
jgi:SAM-dependent methyltransferase